jgi:RND superfamily putative drug exporter
MSLMGKANWWSPPALRRIHDRIGLREHDAAVPPTAPVAPIAETVGAGRAEGA